MDFCGHEFSPYLGKYIGERLLVHMVRVSLALGKTAKFSSKVIDPFIIPTSNE